MVIVYNVEGWNGSGTLLISILLLSDAEIGNLSNWK
jgi:hypothetical protein